MSAAEQYAPQPMTPDEYLTFDRDSEIRHEYVDGEIVAMSGASSFHSQIGINFVRFYANKLLEDGCDVHRDTLRVRVSESKYRYPDIVITCGGSQYADSTFDTLLNPTVLMEILSPSTQHTDIGAKWQEYTAMPTVQDYLIIAQDRASVQRFERQADPTKWMLHHYTGLDTQIRLDSIDLTLELAQLYAKIVLDDAS